VVTAAPRRQPAEVRRQQILDAAQTVMLRRGLNGSTMAEIADVAGLGKGTIYLQFESKQQLVAGLRQRYVDRIEREVATKIAAHPPGVAQLTEFVRTFADASTRDTDLHHLLFQEAGVDETDSFAGLRAKFAEIVRAGQFGTDDLDLAIDFAFGGIHSSLVTLAHTAASRRRKAIAQIAELAARTVSA
jgi:AcrR family transcriptional regulator